MYANVWDTYQRTNDVKNLPRFFRRSGGSIEAVIFDREKGTVTLEPFDYQEFETLRKSGALLYEDVGQHEERKPDNRERYFRISDDDSLPRLFYKEPDEDVVEAVYIDLGKTRVEPFDFQAFDYLRKKGIIKGEN
jgi:hypothetical protein